MKTLKGWTGPKKVDGEIVEGSFHAHQVPLMKAKTSREQLGELQRWLLSYSPAKLFTETGDAIDSIKSIIPPVENNRIGQRAETYKAYQPLKVPDWREFGVEKGSEASCMQNTGKFLDQALVDNPKSLRIFSPGELVSNKLDAILNHTGRNFQWDEFSNVKGGRVVEILSEHTCQGFLQGKCTSHECYTEMLMVFRIYSHRQSWYFPKLRKLFGHYPHNDDSIFEVQQDGSGDSLETGPFKHQLH
jgi:xylulose-5-phosphate/fructose-6-phosphate phosphoketolase